jgi:hypothetical protein
MRDSKQAEAQQAETQTATKETLSSMDAIVGRRRVHSLVSLQLATTVLKKPYK